MSKHIRQLGYLQKEILNIVKREGKVTSNTVKDIYGTYSEAKASLKKLEILGFLKKEKNDEWIKGKNWKEAEGI